MKRNQNSVRDVSASYNQSLSVTDSPSMQDENRTMLLHRLSPVSPFLRGWNVRCSDELMALDMFLLDSQILSDIFADSLLSLKLPPITYAKWVNGTWDQKQFEKEGQTYWDSVVVAGLKLHNVVSQGYVMRKLLALLIAFVDETWMPSYICWKSTTSLANLDYFEFVAGIPKIKDGYTPATCIRPESFFHFHYRNINDYFRRTQELIKELSTPPPESKSPEVGKAVNGLRKHGSDKIHQLAKTLIGEWKKLVGQWVNTTKEIAGA